MEAVKGMLKEFYTNEYYELMAVEDALLTGTEESNCETCGRQLRFVYHVLNYETHETERHGSECFKKLFGTDKVVTAWDGTKVDNTKAQFILKNNEKVMVKMNAKKIKK